MQSVGHSFGILKGYRFGDPDEAQEFLESLRPEELRERNRQESQVRNKLKKRNMGVGNKPRKRVI